MMLRTEGIRRSAATAKTPKSSCARPSSAPRLSATSRAMPSASPISVKACGSMPIAVSRRRVRITRSIARSNERSIIGKALLISMSA